jgi:hypothetical protein
MGPAARSGHRTRAAVACRPILDPDADRADADHKAGIMIDGSQPPEPITVDLDIVGERYRADLGRVVLDQPDGHMRSPILARRADPQPATADVPPGVEMPPLRTFLGPLVWVLVLGLPVLLRVGWQAAAIIAVVALMVREARLRADRSTISFGEGFLGYRGRDGWPHGVQEDDDVHWKWKAVRSAQQGRGARA